MTPIDEQRDAPSIERRQAERCQRDRNDTREQEALRLSELRAPSAVNHVRGRRRQVIRQRRRIQLDVAIEPLAQRLAIERVRVPVRRDDDQRDRSPPGARREGRARRASSGIRHTRTAAIGTSAVAREDRVVDARIHLRDVRRHHQPRVAARSALERALEIEQRQRQEDRGLQLEVMQVIEPERHEREDDAGEDRRRGMSGQVAARSATSPSPTARSRTAAAGCRSSRATRRTRSAARRPALRAAPNRCRRACASQDGRCCRSADRPATAGRMCAIHEMRQMLSSGSSES